MDKEACGKGHRYKFGLTRTNALDTEERLWKVRAINALRKRGKGQTGLNASWASNQRVLSLKGKDTKSVD